ncbi:MAG: hypothetical protein HYZ45_05925 [Burkholderiales bacterium]|nr:hypothetical protein [Burkholderiales bacterium]
MANGFALNAEEVAIAKRVGVQSPESVRIMIVPRIPTPEAPCLQPLLIATNFTNMAGMTLGRGIYIASGHLTTRLLSHELRHAAQYEQFGSIDAFMAEYVSQVVRHGYVQSPLEIDARAHEIAN